MPDARERSEAGEKPEESRGHACAELEPLALAHELAARELIANHERTGARRVHDRYAGLQFPCAREEGRQIDARLPLDPRLERFGKHDMAHRTGAVGERELLPSMRPAVGHLQV